MLDNAHIINEQKPDYWFQKEIYTKLSSHNNALNFLRAILALLVIIGHSYPLAGYGSAHLSLFSDTAVNGFFALSGYLIFGSALKNSLFSYLWRRFLRIYPAFFICLFVVGFGFAGIAAYLEGINLSIWQSLEYIYKNLFVNMQTYRVGDTITNVHFASAWNGSLWTLKVELEAYLVVGLLALVPAFRKNAKFIVPVLFLLTLTCYSLVFIIPWIAHISLFQSVRLGIFFLSGMLIYLFRKTIPAFLPVSVLFLFLCLGLYPIQDACIKDLIEVFFLPYGLLSLGVLLPTTLGTKNDYSYGIYIYAFPIQQILVLVGINRLPFFINIITVVAFSYVFAMLSWHLIEKPALSLKKLVPARRRIDAT